MKRSAFLCEFSAELEQCLPAPDDVECRMEELAVQEIINRFLNSLNLRRRNVFLRRYWYLDSISTIAGQYGLTESAVKTMLFRIRRELRTYLEKEGYAL